MDGLGLLSVLLQQQAGNMDGIYCAASFDEATLVGCYCDNFLQPGVNDPLEYLHGVAQESDRVVIEKYWLQRSRMVGGSRRI